MKKFFVCVAVFLFAVVLAKSLPAQSNDSVLSKEAKEHFDAGLNAAQNKQWPQAITHFGQAQKLAPLSSEVLFNLALAYDKSGNCELVAIPWYKAYLVLAKDASRTEAVRTRIKELEAKVATDIRGILAWSIQVVDGYVGEYKDNPQFASYSEISKVQAQVGDIEGACKTASMLPPSYKKTMKPRFDNLLAIALDNDDLEKAQAIYARMTGDDSIKFSANFQMYDFYLKKQDTQRSNEFLVKAENLAPRVTPATNKYSVYTNLAKIKTQSGDVAACSRYLSLAREIIPKLEFPYFPESTQESRALYYAMFLDEQIADKDIAGIAQTTEEAIAKTQSITGDSSKDRQRVNMFCKIVRSLANSGNMEEAKRVFALADKQKFWVTDELRQRKKKLSETQGLENFDEEKKLIEEIGAKNSIVGPFAAAEASMGDIKAARSTIANMPTFDVTKDELFQPQACLGVVEALTQKGDIANSWEFAALTNSEYYKMTAYKLIALAAIKAGDFNTAQKAINLMNPVEEKDQAKKYFLLEHINRERDIALKELVLAQNAKSDFTASRQTCHGINSFGDRFATYKKIAVLQLKDARPLTVAGSLKNDELEAKFWSEIALRNSQIPFFIDMPGFLKTLKERVPNEIMQYQNPTDVVTGLTSAVSATDYALREKRIMEQYWDSRKKD
ncbi:MAG: hypothetical protein WCI77_07050 [Candidatus Omnitrophota bacterium]